MTSYSEYLVSRVTTLKPTWPRSDAEFRNPFSVLSLLSRQQWCFFLVGMAGWIWDSFDFFTVSLTVSDIAKTFDKSTSDITWGITVVLMLRSVGAVIFGLAADAFGRKWPFIINNVLFIVLEMGTGFSNDYKSFLACRALFGVAMGGLYGNAVATALEDSPPAARGILSGLFQAGYVIGYLLATVFARALVDTTSHGWRSLFWFGSGPPVLIIIFRLCLPETESYRARKAASLEQRGAASGFIQDGKRALKEYWLLFIYLVFLMCGINFIAHGTQDLYPTLLSQTLGFSTNMVTIIQVIANIGAAIGAVLVGSISEIVGRRISIIIMCILGGACIYPYCFVTNKGIIAAAFFEQFCIQGAFGIIPGHLAELTPVSLRSFAIGTAYQLGNLASSASSTIEAKIGEQFPQVSPTTGATTYNYGKVTAIFAACSLGYTILLTFIGPERRGMDLDEPQNDANVSGNSEKAELEEIETCRV